MDDSAAYVPLNVLLRLRGGRFLRDLAIRLASPENRPRSYWYRDRPNFGDAMSPDIIAWVTGLEPVWVSYRYRGKLIGLGSVLDRARPGDAIWGSGSIFDRPFTPPKDCTFLAVRGPLTRGLIRGDVPEVYGDPALLLPHLFTDEVEVKYEIGIVPHYVDRAVINADPQVDSRFKLVDVAKPWETVVREIRSCAAILSSSLHGLIIAEAYGIPAAWIRITDGVVGDGFKFRDYYLSTGRDLVRPMPWERGISAALTQVQPPIRYDPEPLIKSLQRFVWPV